MIRGSWVLTALFNFLIAAIFGLLMRVAFVWEITWMDYRHILHAHSHVAMLGWVYLILYALLLDHFVSPENSRKPIYRWLFWLTQLSVIGMMISFPLQGYGLYSISFSTLHVILGYIFVARLWREIDNTGNNSTLILKAAILALLLSTLGLWGMGPIMATHLKSTPLYFIAVQFYLHFQFNGWFVLTVLALLILLLKRLEISLPLKSIKVFLSLYFIGLVMTFFHVLAWAYGETYMYIINSGGVLFQLAAIGYLFYLLVPGMKDLSIKMRPYSRALLYFALAGLAFKAIFQGLLVIPPLAEVSTIIRNFMIGYVHLITLGITTMFVFLFLKQSLNKHFKINMGATLFLIGFIGTEILLFLQGLFYWLARGMVEYYYEILLGLTIFLPLGLVVLFFRNIHLLNKEFNRPASD